MTLQEIKALIEKTIPGSEAYILDPKQDGQHLEALVISASFEGLPIFKQQKIVMDAIKDIFKTVHAMQLKTFTPAKWNNEKNKYNLEVNHVK